MSSRKRLKASQENSEELTAAYRNTRSDLEQNGLPFLGLPSSTTTSRSCRRNRGLRGSGAAVKDLRVNFRSRALHAHVCIGGRDAAGTRMSTAMRPSVSSVERRSRA